jgi:hypothetical protein
LPWCLWPIVGCEGRLEVGAKTRQPRRKRSPSSREGEGTPDGFREAVHCWTATEGWPYCWIRSLSNCCGFFCTHIVHCYILLYSCRGVMFPVISYLWDMLCCWSISYLGGRTVSFDISTALMHVRFNLRPYSQIITCPFFFRRLLSLQIRNSGVYQYYMEFYLDIYIYIYIYLFLTKF